MLPLHFFLFHFILFFLLVSIYFILFWLFVIASATKANTQLQLRLVLVFTLESMHDESHVVPTQRFLFSIDSFDLLAFCYIFLFCSFVSSLTHLVQHRRSVPVGIRSIITPKREVCVYLLKRSRPSSHAKQSHKWNKTHRLNQYINGKWNSESVSVRWYG